MMVSYTGNLAVLLFSAARTKLAPLSYDDTLRCLHGIPIPNKTLDTSFTPQQERTVLMEIFNQTAGHNWHNNKYWGNDSVSHCTWYGITCDRTSRYIISISLTNKLLGWACVLRVTKGCQAISATFCLPKWLP